MVGKLVPRIPKLIGIAYAFEQATKKRVAEVVSVNKVGNFAH